MTAPLRYLNTILDAARESGRSEREISRTATGQSSALSLIRIGRVPSVERVRLLCAALDLEFYIGPPRAEPSPAPGQATVPPGGDAEPAADDRPPPWLEALRSGIREDVARLLRGSSARAPDDHDAGAESGQGEPHSTRHVEMREISTGSDGTRNRREGESRCHVAFRRDWLARHGMDPALCAVLGVQGEFMEPTVPDGSLILIDCTRRRLNDGRVFVVQTGDGLVVKRARRDAENQWLLVSDHPAWPASPWPDDAKVIGEVRWVAKLLA